jgi:ABC-type sugar transport system permease subunit
VKHRTFFWFILPSALAMLLFIALPIVSVVIQSVFVEHELVIITEEKCDPFGCQPIKQVDTIATAELYKENPLGRFNGLGTYINRNHLAFEEISEIWATSNDWIQFVKKLYNLPFYKALAFTLTYTFCVTPLVLVLGFTVALAVNALPNAAKGPVIFTAILPMIVTPLIGALILFWMIDAEGILGAALQVVFDDQNLSLKASPILNWIMLIVYGAWHHSPFAFVVFYAALQTVPQDTLESAVIDGVSRWEKVRYVVIPHMIPVMTFVGLISLMDNFRVFEPIVGFSAEANATSLSWIIYNDLRNGEVQLFGSAATTSILTIVGVAFLLMPVLIRTWREFNRSN